MMLYNTKNTKMSTVQKTHIYIFLCLFPAPAVIQARPLFAPPLLSVSQCPPLNNT